MDAGWIGRKLMIASRALGERYREGAAQVGPATPVVAAVTPGLLREVGRMLVLGETAPQLAFARTRGVLRIPARTTPQEIARAFNALSALAREYLQQLPGCTPQMEHVAREAVRHAARVTLGLHQRMLRGQSIQSIERLFGGVSLLAFPPEEVLEEELEPARAVGG